jgi:plastocyanin
MSSCLSYVYHVNLKMKVLVILMTLIVIAVITNVNLDGPLHTLTLTHTMMAQNSSSIVIESGASDPKHGKFYTPSYLIVSRGTTVIWTNNDSSPHTVTSGLPSTGPTLDFDSGILTAGQTFSYGFGKSGDFDYYCTLHPFMTGKIAVKG